MVIQPDVVYDAYKSVISNIKDVRNVTNLKKIEKTENVGKSTRTRVIYMSPQATRKKLDQQKSRGTIKTRTLNSSMWSL